MLKVDFEGVTGRVAFDRTGRRRDYQVDVIEQRGDREARKVTSLHLYRLYLY